MAEEKKEFLLAVRGEDPVQAIAPLYSNFLSVSRLGTDVQLEFVFVDINGLAQLTERVRTGEVTGTQEVSGKTIAKVVMPGLSFVQIREHLNTIFVALAEALQAQEVAR